MESGLIAALALVLVRYLAILRDNRHHDGAVTDTGPGRLTAVPLAYVS